MSRFLLGKLQSCQVLRFSKKNKISVILSNMKVNCLGESIIAYLLKAFYPLKARLYYLEVVQTILVRIDALMSASK